MKIRFFLRDSEAKTATALYCLIKYENITIKIYPGLNINPKYWNQKANHAKHTPAFSEHPEFNQRLLKLKSDINKVYLDYLNNHNNKIPSKEILLPLLNDKINSKRVNTTFFSFFKEFKDSLKNGKRINPNTKKPVKGTGYKGYNTTLEHLKEFNKGWKRKLGFDTIDLDFYEDYMAYLTKKNMTVNTKGSHIQRIKAVMNEAVDRGLTENTSFKKRGFAKLAEDVDTIYLNENELKDLQELDLSDSPRLDLVRDIFLIGCYTGLRVSDYSNLKAESIKDGFLKIKSIVKTQQSITIPLHPVAKNIIAKYNGVPPGGVTDVEINRCLKMIGEKVKALNVPVYVNEIVSGSKVSVIKQKWELLSSHTARRSFATNEYVAGTPTITIMAITGHKTEKSFLRYIRVTPEEHAKILMKLWEERSKRSLMRAV